MSNKVQMCFVLDANLAKKLKEHAKMRLESENALIVRLLEQYLALPETERTSGSVDTCGESVSKVCVVDPGLRQALRVNRFNTGESASSLLRRLLKDYFAAHL